jgi:hypothetical protein
MGITPHSIASLAEAMCQRVMENSSKMNEPTAQLIIEQQKNKNECIK